MRQYEYQRLATDEALHNDNLPLNPPEYVESSNGQRYESNEYDYPHESSSTSVPIEQFEIEDAPLDEPSGLFDRAQAFSKKFANNVNTRLISPVSRMIDPIYEGYKFLHMQYERSILKVGNPLVVKRLLYVFIMMLLIFGITKYTSNTSITGANVGAFARGKFYDVDKLADSARQFIDPKSMKENLEYFSSMPHITGSKGDLAFARYIETYMKNNGLHNVYLNEFQSFTNYPNVDGTFLKLADGSFEAKLNEKHSKEMQFLAYNPNALNTIDVVEGEYVYVNYGRSEDLKQLEEKGIDTKGKILLMKYGGNVPEGNKVHFAEKHGAKAVVFITSKFKLADDTEVDDVIQRENVGLTRMSSGDILTPGWSSEGGFVTRLSWDKSETTPRVPTIPISWRDGETLMKKLQNGYTFDDFISGDGSSPVLQLKISNTNRPVHPFWNVVGSIEGREQAEKGIIVGSVRDSACYGTMGSNTGTVGFLELVKILTSLQRKYQWVPSRSIYFVSFDATEYNLAGATEWIENRKEALRKEGYLYIDMSDLVSGDELQIKAHPFLQESLKRALDKVKVDEGGETLLKLYSKRKRSIGNDFLEEKNYVPFINLVNIPSMEVKFKGKVYPKGSCYDTFENFENWDIDKSMSKHVQLVELLSRVIIDFSESPFIPYNFLDLSKSLQESMHYLKRFASSVFKDMNVKPVLHYKNLEQAVDSLKRVSLKYTGWHNDWKSVITASGGAEPPILAMERWAWNDNMVKFNEEFIGRDPQPKRSGYVNALFGVPFSAPEESGDDGFEWNTFPNIRSEIIDHNFSGAQDQIDRLAQMIAQAAEDFLTLG
ncbi:unnamed protein product [Candida parapsilosis]|uniref:FXNA-related family protease 1 n=1 Tax=Candida parapsilosis (strain CDC 317 / ATCC MYA-4646) TaxID=578454 RepID=G8BIG2_CANPC|nr:uncharacterized protein CPAR2_402280 [Candida parapsilosis]KAI5901686.1 Uncharacterized protein K4G60_g824 [Candida parapsilosis]KAI5908952.1 putative protein TRE1 [Candida parapsilosis]CAD1811501.1 unnamed protein product [Candida parapsilosis]CCE44427.1 hypothetical protein CPAR2_402280 [Candida parapsilosis]